MSIYSELSYGERVVSGIRGIQFCVLSEQELRRRSVCEVVEGKTFEGNEPVAGGLFDTRMGVVDGSRVCATCQQRNTFCPGHFGHVVLARPVFYVQFFEVVRKVLKCVCFRCSRLLVDVESPEVRALLARKISRQKRWEAMSKLCQKVKRCGQETLDGCGARVPDKVTKTEDMRLTLSWRDASSASAAAAAAAAASASAAAAAGETVAGPTSAARDVVFNAEDVLRVLRGVTDASCEALGFSSEHAKPEWMICTVLPVPPPAVRPSVRHESGQRQEDDLTHKLCDIIKWNNTLRDKIARGHSFDTIESSYVPMLQYHVATLIDNSVPSMYPSKDRAGRTFRSLTERLRHKEGRIRGNLMGKRVDFSARTVITPDPNLSIDELGVPLKIAMNLTFPEIVGPLTRDELQRLVIAGPDKYPGAKQVRKVAAGNRTIRLKGHPDPASIVLEDGDVVERHLRNGDYVLFNRQPSLHKMSMMAHRVRVMPYHTFRLNVCVCASYNADFDGDEMNMHVPQSLQTLYEIKELAAVPMHILSPRYSKPIITIVQDVALGVFRITQPHVRISQRQLFNLACGNQLLGGYASGAAGAEGAGGALMRVAPGVTSSADMWSAGGAAGEWTGRQVLSTVLPPTASVYMRNDIANPKDFDADVDEIIVEGGVIRSGVLSEKVFSRASRGLVHSTYNTLGAAAVTAMLNSTQKLVCDWLVLSGFSVGVSDLIVSPITTEKKHSAIGLAKAKVHESMRSVHAGTFENNSTKSNADFLEEQIMDILSKATDAAGKLCREGFGIGNNRMLNMIISGSKGKPMNFTQMTACLGGQAIEQKRVPDGFDGRTLPHFTKYDDGPEARGFVEHSFIEGLSPHEFFFHAMAGRIGLIDTAVRSVTWETPIVVVEAGAPRRVRIGEWIDALLAEDAAKKVKRYPEDRDMELLELDREVYIPTADNAGNASWGLLTAVTRHDPGERLYRVKTAGGREATVAESNSLLVWKPDTGTFEPTHSAEVKVGDFLPVIARAPEPPAHLVKTFVDVAEYLPRTEYIHGTDFNVACRCVDALDALDALDADDADTACPCRMSDEAQGGNFFIPEKEFTLPYTKKALLTQVRGRSKTDNIKDGCIYPWAMPERCERGDACALEEDLSDCLLDRFELDEYNGQFLGLYIADGHTCHSAGAVGVSNNDKGVQDFAETWFKKHGFTTRLQANTNDRGTSYTMFANSLLLVRFLDAFVGHGAENKRVPEVAYVAPLVFVRGLLAGYFSGDGSVVHGSISSCTVSQQLNEGIAAMCARLGAFAQVSKRDGGTAMFPDALPLHSINVRAQWGTILSDQLSLIHEEKAAKLQNVQCTEFHRNYSEKNDVVLDAIKCIEVIGVEGHPKLYDVTVPSTLNFALANGMIGRDTSETGYLQRRLVKAMEDCKVHHDLTVRNANNFIVQFLYGEDGMDAIKLEFQELPTLDKEPAEMRDEFLLVDGEIELRGHVSDSVLETIAAMEKAEPGAWAARMEAHFKALVDDRRGVIVGLHGGLKVHDKPVIYPVNIRRIVETAAGLQQQHAKRAAGGAPLVSDLEPTWILDRIDELCSELRVGAELRSGKPVEGIRWMPVLLRCFLSPKTLVRKHRLSRASFDRVVAEVRRDFYAAIASPGEMTGIVAAQSIGEISTQLSSISSTRVQLMRGSTGTPYDGPIGSFVDALMVPGRVVDLGGGSSVLDPDEDIYVVGVGNDEKTSWRRISQVSRHPANGGIVRIKTRSGKETSATLSHSFLKRTERGIVPVLGSDLVLGDRVPVARHIPAVPIPTAKTVRIGDIDVPLSRNFGWLCGAYVADGCISSNQVRISKVIPEFQDQLRKIYAGVFGLEMKQRHGWDMRKYHGTENYVSSRPLASFLLDAFGTGSHDKRVPAWAYAADLPFVTGLLCGYFDGDGNVADGHGKGMIRSASVSEKLTEDVVLLLARVGIFASKCVETHLQEPGRNDLHTVQISRKHAKRFRDEVGPMVVKSKADALENVIAYVERDKGDVHKDKEYIDMIPELGGVIASVAKTLKMSGQSRNFGHLERGGKDLGREALRSYVPKFEETLALRLEESETGHGRRVAALAAMRAELAAAKSQVIPKGVDGRGVMSIAPGSADALISLRSETMGCTALGGANLFMCRRSGKITASIYERHLDSLEAAAAAVRAAELAELADVRDDKMPVLRSALDADVVWDEIVEIERLPDPGEMVYDFTVPGNDSFMVDCGVLVHNTLNTFHGAGVSSFTKVTSGVPRMKELMSMSKNIKTPGMTIRLRREWATSREKAQAVLSSIETTHFRDLVRRSSVHFDPSDGADTSIEDDAGMMAFYREFASGGTGESANASACDVHASPWLLRFEFDRMKMLDLQVTMLDLESTLVDHYDTSVSCVLSDDNAARLVCRMRLSSSALPADSADLLTEVKALEQAIMDQLVVKGVPKIDKAVLSKPMVALSRYDPATDAFIASDEWGIETAGSNLVDVMCHPCVDYTRTVTNDVYEVYTVLGIEAACRMLIDEMRAVLGSETPLDHRHLALLVDTMSNRGFFMSIDRHGINNRGELGPLAKCSFEQTTDMLIKAGMFAERDRINGVSANIMLGQVAPCGTGDCMVLIDGERMAAMGKPVPLPLPKGQQQQRQLGPPQQQGQSDAPANALEVNNMPALEVAPARASKEEDPAVPAAAAPRRKKNVAKLDIV